MHVVDDEEEPPARCCEAHQLGGGDEQPLVAGLAGPWHVLTGERSLELGPELVGEPVEQGWVPPAQVTERFEHRGVWPRPLDFRGGSLADAPSALAG